VRRRGIVGGAICGLLLYLWFLSALSGRVAQLVEHTTENRSVDSSILSPATKILKHFAKHDARRRTTSLTGHTGGTARRGLIGAEMGHAAFWHRANTRRH
jgi:hypothetical protein